MVCGRVGLSPVMIGDNGVALTKRSRDEAATKAVVERIVRKNCKRVAISLLEKGVNELKSGNVVAEDLFGDLMSRK